MDSMIDPPKKIYLKQQTHLSMIGMTRDYAMRREFVYITMLNHGII